MYKGIKRIHMVGIGGSGMSGIAEILLNLGYEITGSDLKKTSLTERLKNLGVKIFYGHSKKNVGQAELVVVSTAIPNNNPEVLEAKKRNIPVIHRSEMLSELARLKYTITVAGTHGKTTVTTMIGLILQYGGLDPTVIIGGIARNYGSGAKLGKGEFLVTEADESDGSFHNLTPTISVVTNIDDDHLDYYKTMKKLRSAFLEHINKTLFYGCSFLCYDDKNILKILKDVKRRYFTYSLNNHQTNIYAQNIHQLDGKYTYDVYFNNRKVENFEIKLCGLHNVLNSLPAIGVGLELDVPLKDIKHALSEFENIKRRIELKGEINGVKIIDDYAHHPTEITTTIKAIRDVYKPNRLVVIFQPHRYTRTKLLFKSFGKAFKYADEVHLMDIYPASEKPIPKVSSKLIYDELNKNKKSVFMFSKTSFKKRIMELSKNDIIVTLGAGDVWKIADEILSKK